MPNFRYEALDATGQSRSGEIEADDVIRAAAQLAEQSLVVLSIELVVPPAPAAVTPPIAPVLDSDPSAVQSGYEARIDEVLSKPEELIKLLEALADEPASAGLSKQLAYLLEHLRQGVKAQQFLRDERLCIWLPIVMSGEKSSTLDARYAQWLRQLTDERDRRRSLIATFSYPVVLVALAMFLLLPICVFIVPTFQRMFREFGLTLPAPTRLLFTIADLVNHRPHYLVLGVAGLLAVIGAAVYGWKSQALTTRWFGWLIAGNSVSLVAMSRLTSVLAELIELGAPLPEALLLAGRASRHAYYRQAALSLAGHLSSEKLELRASPVAHNFPPTLLHALSLVESDQRGVPLIRELSHLYSDRVSARLNRRSGISSPLMVIAIGMVVGLTVISLFMPLVQMVTSLT